MYFKNAQELVEFFNKLDLEKSTLVFKNGETVQEKADCACKGQGACQCGPKKEVKEKVEVEFHDPSSVLVESFCEEESFRLKLTEEDVENTFYVSDYAAVKDACGTGKIVLPHRTLYMNMCEMDDKAIVDLDIIIEGQKFTDVSFVLKKTEDKPYLQVNKDHLSS